LRLAPSVVGIELLPRLRYIIALVVSDFALDDLGFYTLSTNECASGFQTRTGHSNRWSGTRGAFIGVAVLAWNHKGSSLRGIHGFLPTGVIPFLSCVYILCWENSSDDLL